MVYSIVGIVAIITNLIINRDIVEHRRGETSAAARSAYRVFNFCILAYFTTDVLWGFCDASGSQWLLYADTVVYYLAMYLAVLFWARYVVAYLDDKGGFARFLIVITDVLLVMEVAALIVNHFVHFFFWVDETGTYHAYAFRYVALVIQIVLFLLTAFYAFAQRKQVRVETVRARFKTIGCFGFTMSSSILVQMFYPLLPIYSIGYMIGTCIIHSFIIEDENAELRRRADEANQAKTSFLFSMSHDIRTPMNAILGFTAIGLRHADDEKTVQDCFTKIQTSGNHLLNLINDILEMSRIESGNLELAENPTDIRDAIAGVEAMSHSLAVAKSIDFATLRGEITDPYVYSDELHINEILINLISNAIKYTLPGGQVRYRIEQLGPVRDGKVRFRFVVSDTGIGMSEEFQKHLFETFSRETTTTVSKTEGSGIGLSIVKKLIDLAGGTIAVQSAPRVGSTFTVELPFRVMDAQAIEAFEAEKVVLVAPPDSLDLRGKRVLLVEDNAMNREIAIDLLTEAGFEAETAEDGEIAVKRIAAVAADYYDFVLMDIQMPVMNGYEATQAIRKLPGCDKLPIIALSANAFEEDKQKSLAAGMNEHIAKPIDVQALFAAIRRLVQ